MSERATRGQGRESRRAFLDATGALLRRQGYAATGLSEIVAASGAPRGSLYFHFPGGKEELAVAAMERTAEQLRAGIAALAERAGSPDAALGSLIDALAAGLESSGYRDGCPIATVALETSSGSEALREASRRAFAAWAGELEKAFCSAGADAAASEQRALFVLSAIEGALILARARRDTAPLRAVREELGAMFS